MADTVLESLEEDISKAFKTFAMKPTQSARIQLRHDLMTIAGALEVEAYNMDTATAATLNVAITDLKALAETALVAPLDALITAKDRPAKPQKQVVPAPVSRSTRDMQRFGSRFLNDLLRFFTARR